MNPWEQMRQQDEDDAYAQALMAQKQAGMMGPAPKQPSVQPSQNLKTGGDAVTQQIQEADLALGQKIAAAKAANPAMKSKAPSGKGKWITTPTGMLKWAAAE